MKPGAFPVAGELRAASRLKRKNGRENSQPFLGEGCHSSIPECLDLARPEELPCEATSAIVRPYRPSSRKTRSRNPLGSSCCLAPERWGRASSARTRNSQPLASSLQVPTWLSQKHYGPEATTYGVVPNRHIRRAILREGGRPVSCCGFSFGHFLLAIWKRKMKTAGKNSQPFVGEAP